MLKYEYEALPYYLARNLRHSHMTLNSKMPKKTFICLNSQRVKQAEKSRKSEKKKVNVGLE